MIHAGDSDCGQMQRKKKKKKMTEKNRIKRTFGNSHDQSSRHIGERKVKKS